MPTVNDVIMGFREMVPDVIAPNGSALANADANGKILSAATCYRWMNEALVLAAKIGGGGIPDFTAVNSVSGQPLYVLTGKWHKIDTAWYDGYPLYLGRQTDIFRRNLVPGVVGAAVVRQVADRFIMEMWPQPSRTSGATVLAGNGGAITATATTALVGAITPPFVLGFGYLLIDSEIIGFQSISAGQINGMIRGLGGTVAAVHNDGAVVTELNIMFCGLRIPSVYSVGQNASVWSMADGYDIPVQKIMLHFFREMEKRRQDAASLLSEAAELIKAFLKMNRQFAGPVQIQANVGRGAETYPGLGGPFGGVIMP